MSQSVTIKSLNIDKYATAVRSCLTGANAMIKAGDDTLAEEFYKLLEKAEEKHRGYMLLMMQDN